MPFGPRSSPPSLLVAAAVLAVVVPLTATVVVARHADATAGRPALYVSQRSGHDTARAGRAAAPFRTIAYALAHAHPGTTVHVAPGTYAPFVMRVRNVTVTGTSQSRVVVRGTAHVRGIAQLVAPRTTVSNMTFTKCVPNPKPYGDFEAAGSSSIRVAGTATGAVVSAVAITRGTGTTPEGLPFGCFGVYLSRPSGVSVTKSNISGQGEGVFIFRKGQSVRITGNRIHDNHVEVRNTRTPNDDFGGTGIGLFETSGSPGPLVSSNYIYNNIAPSHDYGTDGGAFDVFQASDATISHNRIYNNENVLETGAGTRTHSCSNNVFANNTVSGRTPGSHLKLSVGMILRCASGMQIVHNTFTHLDWYVFDIEQHGLWMGPLQKLTISANTIAQNFDIVYVLLVDPHKTHMTINKNRYRYLGSLGLDWNKKHWKTLPTWRRATRMDAASSGG